MKWVSIRPSESSTVRRLGGRSFDRGWSILPKNFTINGERYHLTLSKFFFKQIEEADLDNIWFQQDGATCHTANATLNLLRPIFENHIINKRGDVNWHPRSCDLTPLDYFLWGAVKDKCYSNHPETIQDLKYEIQAAVAAIRPETIEKVLQNWVDRISYCKLSRGGHLSEIVFHK